MIVVNPETVKKNCNCSKKNVNLASSSGSGDSLNLLTKFKKVYLESVMNLELDDSFFSF